MAWRARPWASPGDPPVSTGGITGSGGNTPAPRNPAARGMESERRTMSGQNVPCSPCSPSASFCCHRNLKGLAQGQAFALAGLGAVS
jgi:hypothetical protein